MTPNDIYNRKFEKSMGGYKQEDVNRFQIEVGDFVAQILEEREDLLQKMEFLAEKLEEYRNDEESLRAAIIGAQKLGDSVVKESRQKAELLLADAKSKAETILAEARKQSESMQDDTRRSIETEQYALERAKIEVSKFKKMVLAMYDQQITLINTIPYTEDLRPVPPAHLIQQMNPLPVQTTNPAPAVAYEMEAETTRESFTEGSDEALSGLVFEEVAVHEGVEDEIPEEGQTRRNSRFGPLKFGEDYSLTRKD